MTGAAGRLRSRAPEPSVRYGGEVGTAAMGAPWRDGVRWVSAVLDGLRAVLRAGASGRAMRAAVTAGKAAAAGSAVPVRGGAAQSPRQRAEGVVRRPLVPCPQG